MKGGRMFALILVFVCVFGTAMGQIAMKSGMNQVGEINSLGQLLRFDTLLHIFTNPRILIGVGCYGISALLWLAALSTLNVSFMYPFMSLAYVITAVVAFVFLKENVALIQWLGILLVMGGCFMIARAAY